MNQKSTILLSFAALLVGSATVIILQQRKLDHLRVLTQQIERQQSQPGNNVAVQFKSKPSSGPDNSRETNSTSSTTDLQALISQRNSFSRMRSLADYVDRLAPHQIADAFFELRDSPNWGPGAHFLEHMLLTRWTQEDPNAALAGLEELPPEERGGAATHILSSIASVDPQMAAQWLAEPDNLTNQDSIGETLATLIAREWAHQDSAAAEQWAQSLSKNQRRGAMNGIIDTLLSTDPGAAANFVTNMDDSSERRSAADKVAEAWAQRDPLLAIEWAQGLNANERTGALEAALGSWAQSSPVEAALFIDELPQAQRTENQVSRVAHEWSLRDPASAAEWLGNQPDDGGKVNSIWEVMSRWMRADPEAASTWLSQQPRGQSYDNGADSLVVAIYESDPVAAIQWTATISDRSNRSVRIEDILKSWHGNAPEAAQAWAKENQIQIPESENAP